MKRELAYQVANAVLYEGYMLYPYRPSAIKNRQRWSFGILYPPAYSEVQSGTERSQMHSECLLETVGSASLVVRLRFLHLFERQLYRLVNGYLEPVPRLSVDERVLESRDEGVETSMEFNTALTGESQVFDFELAGEADSESLRDASGREIGVLKATRRALRGQAFVFSEEIRKDLWKLKIDIVNQSSFSGAASDRNTALLSSLLSAHLIVTAQPGGFVSLLDPPENLREHVRTCTNVGNFPVLLGTEGERDMLLCSPIVLYDYPQVAPQSAGDFYDATEIDEMLTLRLLTLSDAEKAEMRRAEARTRALLERTEQSAREQLARTHGVMRKSDAASSPIESSNTQPESLPAESVTILGMVVKAGDRVRIWPRKSADIMDIALQGKVAIVEAIERDFDNRTHVAVVLEDDPGRDLGFLRQPGHRFFFAPDEIELLSLNSEAAK